MAISALERKQIARSLTAYCDEVPPHVRHQLRHTFKIGPTSVELFEERPAWDDPKKPWTRAPVAKFRYVTSRAMWELFCVHRDLKWHHYERLPSAGRFDLLLAEVRRDPTGIF